MPAKPGESVGEMLAAHSTEKAWASLNRGATEGQRSALTRFLNEKARKRRRPWK